MIRTLIAVAIAAAVISPVTANAGHAKRRMHHSHHAQMWNAPVSMQRGYHNPGRLRHQTARPPWASPAECYEDLGYGRFESCDN